MTNKIIHKQPRFHLKPACAAVLLAFTIQTIQANPIGPSVVNGQASFATSGNTLTVTNTPGAIINWQGFSIGTNEITRFAQQSASSAVLNRVISNNPSSILGSLQSNGRVFLVNPNGIVFGQGATINVAGLVATSLNMSNADFIAGRYNFTDVPGAQNISNAGNLTAQSGGQIYLIAPNVENTGIINAPNGEILLAAGHSVELVDTTNPNLRVNITAPAGDATNVGQLVAEAGSLGLFGTVVRNSGTVSADSATMQGGKIVFRASQRVEAGGVVSAQGTGGGNIAVLADMQSGMVNVSGTLDASAPNGGNGGFIETSAAYVQVVDTARITTAAAQGNAGMWLLDPYDFTIAATGGDITGAALSAALGAGAVTIQTVSPLCTGAACGTGNPAGNGDIFVNDTVSWSINTLTLTAERDININAVMTASGSSSLVMNPATTVFGSAVKMGFNPDGSFKGRVDFGARSGTGFLTIGGYGYTVINDVTALQNMCITSLCMYAIGSNIDASATSTWNAGLGFAPVGTGPAASLAAFYGRFDGLGHTITGLTINRPAVDYVGLFGFTNGAKIRNIGLEGGSVIGRDYVGGLVGQTWSSASDIISNSYNTGTVSGSGAGGMGGVGGLVGYNSGAISNSYNTGIISGGILVGGLVGKGGGISNSYNTGAVSGSGLTTFVGGLTGEGGGISNSYNMGAVSGNDTVGGLVGYQTGTIINSYNTGSVGGSINVGGLSGWHYGGAITNSYNAGSVSGSTNVGGLVGNRWSGSGAITSSYWDSTQTPGNCAGIGSIAGCTGLPTVQMKQQASFTGWDFTNIWYIDENVSYPTLRVFGVPVAINTDIFWDGGAGDLLWLSALNWSGDTLPTSANHVLIDTGAAGGSPLITVTISSGAQGTDNLISFEHLLISSAASLAIAGTATINANLTSDGITSFNGTGAHSITGAVSGAGAINLIAGTLTAGTAFNIGSLGMSGGSLALGSLNSSVGNFSQSAGTLSGTGDFTVSNSYSQTGGSFPSTFNNLSITQASGDLSVGALQAVNSIALTATTGDVLMQNDITVTGTGLLSTQNAVDINAIAGNFIFDGSGGISANSGSISIVANGLVELDNGDMGTIAYQALAGNVTISSINGDVWATGGANITGQNVSLSAANGVVQLYGYDGGNINATAGNATITSGGAVDLGNEITSITATGSAIINAGGAITNSGGNLSLVTANTLDAIAVGGIALTTQVANLTTSNTGAGNTLINNTGALTVNGMTDTLGSITLINAGDVLVGDLSVTGTGLLSTQNAIDIQATGWVKTAAMDAASGSINIAGDAGVDLDANDWTPTIKAQAGDVNIASASGNVMATYWANVVGQNVNINAAGSVSDGDASNYGTITANALSVSAGSGIDLHTAVGSITTANSVNGSSDSFTLINNTGALTVNGMTDPWDSIELNNAGSVSVVGGMSANGVALTVSGVASDISITGSGGVNSGGGAISLNAVQDIIHTGGAQQINTSSGAITLTAGRDIVHTGANQINTSSGAMLLDAGRDILHTGSTTSQINSFSGAMTLMAGRDIIHTDASQINSFSGAMLLDAGRDIVHSGSASQINNYSGSLTITAGQDFIHSASGQVNTFSGAMTIGVGGNFLYTGSGQINTASVAAQAITVGGNFTVSGASSQVNGGNGGQTITVGNDLTIENGGSISNYSSVVATTLQVGNDLILPDGQIRSSGLLSGSIGRDVTITGGLSSWPGAGLFGTPDIGSATDPFTVGGVIRLDDGSGSDAQIHSGSIASIWIHFPNLASGGYFVNGTEGVVSSGSSGFYANGVPAVLDSNLHITYGLTAASGNILSFLPDLVNTVLIPGNGASGASQSTIGSGEEKKEPPPVVVVNGEVLPADSNVQALPVCPL